MSINSSNSTDPSLRRAERAFEKYQELLLNFGYRIARSFRYDANAVREAMLEERDTLLGKFLAGQIEPLDEKYAALFAKKNDALVVLAAIKACSMSEPRDDGTVWDRAIPAPLFIAQGLKDEVLDVDLLTGSGVVTAISALRGLGKTHFLYYLAIAIATGGVFRGQQLQPGRVLLLDRDNPEDEIKRRQAQWGAIGAQALDIMGRGDVPPLIDRRAWAEFPVDKYDYVFLDSFSAATEGVEERSGGDSGRALVSLLDIARRKKGPGVVILGNTTKNGQSLRGSGVIEDRADIIYEVRDATDLKLDPKKEYWEECLPDEGSANWASRSKRHAEREVIRLAFISSKFRVGPVPAPWAMELRMLKDGTAWSVNDVTSEIENDFARARGVADTEQARAIANSTAQLKAEIASRQAAGSPITQTEAVEFLRKQGLTRDGARAARDAGVGRDWELADPTECNRGHQQKVLVRKDA